MQHSFQEDEISLLDILDFFKENIRFILRFTYLFFVLGTVFAILTNPKYEAIGNIQMAKVANVAIEEPAQLVEKLKIPTYYSSESIISCDLEKSETASEDLVRSLKPTLNRNAPIITISHRAKSAKQSKACVESVLQDIRKSQHILVTPLIASKQSYLSTLKSKLETAERIKGQLSDKAIKFDFNDSKFSAASLVIATSLNKENEINDLTQQIFDLEQSLQFPQTSETFLASPIHEKKTSSHVLVIITSILMGFFVGVGVALLRTSLQNFKK